MRMNTSQESMNALSANLRRAREWVCVSHFSTELRLPDSTKESSAPSGCAELKCYITPSSGRKGCVDCLGLSLLITLYDSTLIKERKKCDVQLHLGPLSTLQLPLPSPILLTEMFFRSCFS